MRFTGHLNLASTIRRHPKTKCPDLDLARRGIILSFVSIDTTRPDQNRFSFPSSSLLSSVRWVGPAAPNPSSDTEFDES
ncbi:hypothetical protein BLA23254_01533 [Burkholderia lata]|uniref:Uncharacterized protein n=1 Tax=Burkholderia lata (strain ATCC 17760 / DSM 23089 / LMG 22485 / NCIMB 9086 / R18194 / 383) TaxID=482957 RepID=A0A6P2J1T0_BURL3|nr:hypothetical protein BLA23254_01533 [Burkholderia lata]